MNDQDVKDLKEVRSYFGENSKTMAEHKNFAILDRIIKSNSITKQKTMKNEETLTKENFWNEVYSKYPNATKLFCDWIDDYKKSVDWNILFNAGAITRIGDSVAPKFHEIPYAFQQGIWIDFANHILNEYYEQPEYIYSMDLREDINKVLSEIERALVYENTNQ